MGRKIDYYKKALHLMEQLYKKYPQNSLGQHLSTALSDYGDFWGISDKEFCFALEKYSSQQELDIQQIAPQAYVDKVIKDADDIFSDIADEDDMEEF